jgi:hypothetical protein
VQQWNDNKKPKKVCYAFFVMLRNYKSVNAGMPEKSYSGIGIFYQYSTASVWHRHSGIKLPLPLVT